MIYLGLGSNLPSSFGDRIANINFAIELLKENNIKIIKNASRDKNKPKALIFNTIKGKGIKNFENKLISHYRPPTEEELKEILEEN